MQFALSGTQFDIFRQAEQTTRTLFLQHTFEAFSAHLWWTLHVRLMGEIFKSYLGTHIITTVITAVPLSSWFLKWTKLGKHTVHIVLENLWTEWRWRDKKWRKQEPTIHWVIIWSLIPTQTSMNPYTHNGNRTAWLRQPKIPFDEKGSAERKHFGVSSCNTLGNNIIN